MVSKICTCTIQSEECTYKSGKYKEQTLSDTSVHLMKYQHVPANP